MYEGSVLFFACSMYLLMTQALYSQSMNKIRYQIEVESGVDLTHLNTFGVPATAAAYTSIQSTRQLEMVARSFAADEVLILGGGSNILFLNI